MGALVAFTSDPAADYARAEAADRAEAAQLVEILRRHQAALGASDVAFCHVFPALGSPRSWSRLRSQQWAACPPAKWLAPLRQLVAEIEAAGRPVVARLTGIEPIVEAAEHWVAQHEWGMALSHIALAERRLAELIGGAS